MVHLPQFSALHLLTLLLFILLLLLVLQIYDAGVIKKKFVIVKLFDYEFLLKLVVWIEEELTTNKEQGIAHYIHKALHCGQCNSLSFTRQQLCHPLEKSRSHQSICEPYDLPFSNLLILQFHILSPQNSKQSQKSKTDTGLELLKDKVQKGHDFGVAEKLLINVDRLIASVFLQHVKCPLKRIIFLRNVVDYLLTCSAITLTLEQFHIISYIFFEDELMFLHETHLEVLINPQCLHLYLSISYFNPSIAYLSLKVGFQLLGFFG